VSVANPLPATLDIDRLAGGCVGCLVLDDLGRPATTAVDAVPPRGQHFLLALSHHRRKGRAKRGQSSPKVRPVTERKPRALHSACGFGVGRDRERGGSANGGGGMLAQLNVVILSIWLIAEIVPLVADRLATLERARSPENEDE
jgi:hypothetical protein